MLLRACRGALLGSPVADDFAFLYRIAFQHPLDLLDSMGATFYWRPMSRQLYFSLVGGAVLARPWVASAVNAALLLALGALLYRIARRGMAPPVAATIALFPLLAEPARALLAWPSGAQHLLAAVGAALALHEALAGRRVTAAAAALAGVLSHESAALVLPGLPLVAWFRTRDRRETALWAGAAAAVAALWMAGYAIARHHGVAMPPRVGGLSLIGRLPRLLLLALTATLNLEEAPSDVYLTVVLGTLALIAIAVVLIVRGHRCGPRRRRWDRPPCGSRSGSSRSRSSCPTGMRGARSCPRSASASRSPRCSAPGRLGSPRASWCCASSHS